jgi:predicted lipid carrier protein YhbT/chorismate mutase
MADPVALARLRRAIDCVDDGMLLLLAGRGRLVARVAWIKRGSGLPMRDPGRESRVHARAQTFAARLGLRSSTARAAIAVALADAWRAQGIVADVDQGVAMDDPAMIPGMIDDDDFADGERAADTPRRTRLLRLLPPPTRLAPLLRALPQAWQRRLLEAAVARVLSAPIEQGALDFMAGRRLGIDVSDLDLHWVLELRDGRLCATTAPADTSVRGPVTDLLLLAGRLEDADTLFFQRRLVLTGDTELGLTVRNLLDRLPWESVPLGLRIVLHRGARFARSARAAHRGMHPGNA